jgi:hypothetical protein
MNTQDMTPQDYVMIDGIWKLTIRYEPIAHEDKVGDRVYKYHRYYIEGFDLRYCNTIRFDSNVIDADKFVEWTRAINMVKHYFKTRFGYEVKQVVVNGDNEEFKKLTEKK